MGDETSLTEEQREALEWLSTVGKATPSTLARHGYSVRTLDSLVDRGLVDRELHMTFSSNFPIFRPKS